MVTDTRANYAIASAVDGNYEHAKAVVIDLIAEDYNNAEAHRAWAKVLLHEGKSTDSVAAYRVAVTLEPHDAGLQFEFAKALVVQRQKYAMVALPNLIEAREAVSAGLRLAPGDPQGLALRDQIEQSLKDSSS